MALGTEPGRDDDDRSLLGAWEQSHVRRGRRAPWSNATPGPRVLQNEPQLDKPFVTQPSDGYCGLFAAAVLSASSQRRRH